jgi:hypothetical protein
VSTPSKERVAAMQVLAAAATSAQLALVKALASLTEAAEGFNGIRQSEMERSSAYNAGRLSTVIDMLRPLAAEYRDVADLYRRTAAAEQSERDAHRELYGEEAR